MHAALWLTMRCSAVAALLHCRHGCVREQLSSVGVRWFCVGARRGRMQSQLHVYTSLVLVTLQQTVACVALVPMCMVVHLNLQWGELASPTPTLATKTTVAVALAAATWMRPSRRR